MNELFKKDISVSNHFFNKNKSHRSNIINSSIIINNKKMKNIHINRDNDKDLKFRHNNESLNRFKSILSSRIQIRIVIKHIPHSNNSYKIKNRI